MGRTALDDRELTYPEVGATTGALPQGYRHISARRVIGTGEAKFTRASEALLRWEVQRRAGLSVADPIPPIVEGTRVLLRLGPRLIGIDAPCEVVYVIDEPRRKGFAYGTLDGHPEHGEERFCVQWCDDDSVEFTIIAFSRPALWWTRAAGPLGSLAQRRITERYLKACTAAAGGSQS